MSMLKSHSHTLSLSLLSPLSLLSQLSPSHSITLDMLNKFCFHLYAENSLFIAENCNGFFWTSSTSPYPDTFSLSPSLTLTLSYSHTLSISHSITLDMLNNFCFDLYAQKSLFIAENCNGFFLTSSSPYPVTLEFIELVPS